MLGDSRKSVSHFCSCAVALPGFLCFLCSGGFICIPLENLFISDCLPAELIFTCSVDYADLSNQRLGFHLSQRVIAVPKSTPKQDSPIALGLHLCPTWALPPPRRPHLTSAHRSTREHSDLCVAHSRHSVSAQKSSLS